MEIIINNTFFTGKFLIHLPSVDSTNTYAKEHLSKRTPIDGTVILADEQYAGRGQAGNIWQSTPGENLTFSIIYKTDFLQAAAQFGLNMAISLGIRTAVAEIIGQQGRQHMNVSIKWPNDIYIDDKKVAGILIENTISGMYLKHSIIGIGLNVNQQDFAELTRATSLRRELDKSMERISVLKEVLAAIERYFFLLKEGKTTLLKSAYISHLYRYNEMAAFEKDNLPLRGCIKDVSPTGLLIMDVMQEDGSLQEMQFAFKEIAFR
ncbi:MAG TPA: biotin--[acetyl-CoA-carboxylase] ligase [Chitinophagales bacterium]|nr:biotin--[acetyl-CoA-carboxylase] ligase [Chitinophagales bacterium]